SVAQPQRTDAQEMLAILLKRSRIEPMPEFMTAPFPQRRILVVDDEPFVCDALKMMLTFDGHIVETASNGKEALAMFEVGKFDLIITDFAMPTDRKSTRLNSSHDQISYAVFCL